MPLKKLLDQANAYLASYVGEDVTISGQTVTASVWGQPDSEIDLGTGKLVSRLHCRVAKSAVPSLTEGMTVIRSGLAYRVADLVADPVDTAWQFRLADPKKLKPLR